MQELEWVRHASKQPWFGSKNNDGAEHAESGMLEHEQDEEGCEEHDEAHDSSLEQQQNYNLERHRESLDNMIFEADLVQGSTGRGERPDQEWEGVGVCGRRVGEDEEDALTEFEAQLYGDEETKDGKLEQVLIGVGFVREIIAFGSEQAGFIGFERSF
jgi:hypothetical protein